MEKTKRDTPWKASRGMFIAVWVIASIIANVITNVVSAVVLSRLTLFNDIGQRAQIVSMLGSLVAALVQVQLVERLLRHTMRGWMLYTSAGLVATWALYVLMRSPFMSQSGFMSFLYGQWSLYGVTALIVLISTAPPALLQALWLRRHVRQAWLWPLVILVLGFASQAMTYFTISQANPETYALLGLPLTLITTVITGLTMHYLITHPRDTEKAKTAYATDAHDHARVERLQDAEEHAAPWLESNQQTQNTSR